MKIYRLGLHERKISFEDGQNNTIIYNQKDDLIKIKCKIDQYNPKDWENTKKKLNQHEYIYTSSSKNNHNICNITPVSRSYFKLHEMIKDLNLVKNKSYCACIAEGPGGFIHCLNDYTVRHNIQFLKI